MMTDRMATDGGANRLGAFLKDRRQRIDAAALGFGGRRRTPGLRREEVAQRAHISATWYTWLEQGRGGPPSPRVLDSLADALILTAAEREHLFLVGLGHPPKAHPPAHTGVSARLQRLLDAMTAIPAIVVTVRWDVLAWNCAACLLLTDYDALPPDGRNVMRRMFLDPAMRAAHEDWEDVARFVVATFRAGTARTDDNPRAADLVAELSEKSADFRRLWRDNDVLATGEGVKRLRHPIASPISVEFSSFAVDGRPDLRLIVYNPAGPEDTQKLRTLYAP
jgi:transcriptional regulator with XRE-family HTH domain